MHFGEDEDILTNHGLKGASLQLFDMLLANLL
jgi:hypothetical protein